MRKSLANLMFGLSRCAIVLHVSKTQNARIALRSYENAKSNHVFTCLGPLFGPARHNFDGEVDEATNRTGITNALSPLEDFRNLMDTVSQFHLKHSHEILAIVLDRSES